MRVHRLALLDAAELAEDDGTDLALFEVERETEGAVLELQQFVRHGRGQALDLRDAVAGNGDRTDLLARGRVRLVRLDKVLQRVPDLLRPDRELRHLGSLLSLLGPKFHLGGWGLPPRGESSARPNRAARYVLRVECCVWWLPSSRAIRRAGVLEAVRDGAVDDLVADPHPDPAEDLGVHVEVQVHLAAVELRQGGAEALLLRVAQRHRRGDDGDHAVPALGGELGQGLESRLQATSPRRGHKARRPDAR